jgi:hypothetical protein
LTAGNPYSLSNYNLQKVAQSAVATPNEAEVTSSNPPPFLVRTCQKKKINNYNWIIIWGNYIKLPRTSSQLHKPLLNFQNSHLPPELSCALTLDHLMPKTMSFWGSKSWVLMWGVLSESKWKFRGGKWEFWKFMRVLCNWLEVRGSFLKFSLIINND